MGIMKLEARRSGRPEEAACGPIVISLRDDGIGELEFMPLYSRFQIDPTGDRLAACAREAHAWMKKLLDDMEKAAAEAGISLDQPEGFIECPSCMWPTAYQGLDDSPIKTSSD